MESIVNDLDNRAMTTSKAALEFRFTIDFSYLHSTDTPFFSKSTLLRNKRNQRIRKKLKHNPFFLMLTTVLGFLFHLVVK